MNRSKTRRRFLQATTAIMTGLTGCSALQDNSTPENPSSTPTETDEETSTQTETETSTSTEVSSPELVAGKDGMAIQWTPEIHTVEEFPDRHKVEFQINTNTDSSPDRFKLFASSSDQDQKIAENSSGQFDLTAADLPDGENDIYGQVVDGSETRQTETTTFNKDVPETYRADIKHVENREPQNVRLSSIYGFDDHEIDLQALDEWHTNDQEEFLDQTFINYIQNENLPGNPQVTVYPEGDTFDLEKFKSAQSLEEAIHWVQAAWIQYDEAELHGISGARIPMATSMEYAIEEINQQNINTRLWGHGIDEIGGNGGHGLVMGVNEDNRNLRIIETTVVGHPIAPESAYAPGGNEYNRWAHPLFHYEDATELDSITYEDMKGRTEVMLGNMISQNPEKDFSGQEAGSSAMTDEWITSALEPMRQGTLPIEIEEQQKEYFKTAYDTEESTILAGTIDDPKIYTGPGLESLANDINTNPQTYTVEDIENELTG